MYYLLCKHFTDFWMSFDFEKSLSTMYTSEDVIVFKFEYISREAK